MADQVSWKMIEEGWLVVGSDGQELGKVHEVLGDSGVDIFSGLAVSPGMLRHSRYVPAESVSRIEEGRIEVDLDRDQFERQHEYGKVPPHAQVRADTTDLPDSERP
jgi:Uncharacterized protein conserved in bacteria (DUF2171)